MRSIKLYSGYYRGVSIQPRHFVDGYLDVHVLDMLSLDENPQPAPLSDEGLLCHEALGFLIVCVHNLLTDLQHHYVGSGRLFVLSKVSLGVHFNGLDNLTTLSREMTGSVEDLVLTDWYFIPQYQ